MHLDELRETTDEQAGDRRALAPIVDNTEPVNDRRSETAARDYAGPLTHGARRRRSIRLKGYDYAQSGAYFLTICTKNRACVFGEVVDSSMRLNDAGCVVRDEWIRTATLRPYVQLERDEFVVMPNHVHGIVWIVAVGWNHAAVRATGPEVGAQRAAPLPAPRVAPHSIGAIVRAFKSATTRCVNQARSTPGAPLWQRNYYEHVVRDERALEHIRRYIATNPARWTDDSLNPRKPPR